MGEEEEEENNAYMLLVGKTEGRRPLERRILERHNGGIGTGLIWLRIGTSGGLL
jgi:hypothetical protein